jgi:multicomponent Na+:H+ antiporter subunit B
MMRKVITVLLLAGFLFYFGSLVTGMFLTDASVEPREVGSAILAGAENEAGSANTVTSVVVLYRGFDTLGEVTVLFLAASGIALLFGHAGTAKKKTGDSKPGFILRTGGRLLYPFFFLFGLYVIIHGHLSPGGGFPGGVIVATGFFVALLTGDNVKVPEGLFAFFEGVAGLGFIGLGLIGLFGQEGSFLAQVFPLGDFGSLFSAGIIPFIYAVIGIKVSAELAGAVGRFYTSDEGESV